MTSFSILYDHEVIESSSLDFFLLACFFQYMQISLQLVFIYFQADEFTRLIVRCVKK